MSRVIIIGAGPSGMMAAGQAAELGAEVVLLEKTKSAGRKLKLTGAGTCNLTNILSLDDFITHVHGNGRFLRQALSRFKSANLIAFIEELGVATRTEPNGRVYPASRRAADVVNALKHWMDHNGVEVITNSPAERLILDKNQIIGVETPNGVLNADAVIIATGGASYPQTGSTGDGYRLAELVGHNIIPTRPSQIPLELPGDLPSRLQGLSLPKVRVRVVADGRRAAERTGELIFTHFGLSGPAILSMSRHMVDALIDGMTVAISLDLLPDFVDRALDAHLLNEFKAHGKRQIQTVLAKWLPVRMSPIVCEQCGLPPDTLVSQVSAAQRRQLVKTLKAFRLEISGHRPIDEAIVTAGGVDTREVDPRTMASRLIGNLYFAGEVLDVDGDSGGFNLQIAFSTGWLAGQSAAQRGA